MAKVIGVALGDFTGIGPEITLKALDVELPLNENRYVLVGDAQHIMRLKTALGISFPLSAKTDDVNARVSIWQSDAPPLPSSLQPGQREASLAAAHWVRAAAGKCLSGEFDAMVTAPVNKEAIVNAGESGFVGQTELLTALAGIERTAMMLLGQDDRQRWLRVALATTHVPIKEVSARLSREKIRVAIELAAQACRDLALPRARVAVCGLNPHAGEGGKIGTEELTTIIPAVQAARADGLDVVGPFSADALFYYAYRGDYEAVVAMYHDQGLAPLKMVCFEHGINWTLGLPFIRTSPDHGTAYDIAGKGIANPSSMVAAIRLAAQLAERAQPANHRPERNRA